MGRCVKFGRHTSMVVYGNFEIPVLLEKLENNNREGWLTMIKTRYYDSVEEVEEDKNALLKELGMSEEEANDLYRMNLLDYSDQCRVEKIEGLNFLIDHHHDDIPCE